MKGLMMIFSPNALWYANVAPLISLTVAPAACFVALFFFDSPPRDWTLIFVYGMALSVWSYPVTVALGGISALKAYKAGDYDRMFNWTLCTYSSVASFLICIAVVVIHDSLESLG
jgi:hypothetical protein